MRLTYVGVALSWVAAVCVLWLIYWNADLLLGLPTLGPPSNGTLPRLQLGTAGAAVMLSMASSMIATLGSSYLEKGLAKWPTRIMVIFLWSLYLPIFLRFFETSPYGFWDYMFTSFVVAVVVFGLVVLAIKIVGRDQSINHA